MSVEQNNESAQATQRSPRIQPVVIRALAILASLTLSGCLGMPEKVQPVNDFDAEKYLGQWYEIARLDHSFERGLENVTAEYSMREDGGVNVVNRGYSPEDQEWNEASGKAYFVNSPDQGYLKVSFFGPFYGSYVVFELDEENYQYAFVSGPDLSYLWLLSRTPVVADEILTNFVKTAESLGFETKNLIMVDQNL